MTVGFLLSVTVTVKLQEEELPAASVATNVLVVVPTGNVEPLDKPLSNATLAVQLSTVTLKLAIAPQIPKSVFTLIRLGQVMTGFSLYVTVTVKLHVAVLFAASITTKVLIVVPTGNIEPLGKPRVWVIVAPEQVFVNEGT